MDEICFSTTEQVGALLTTAVTAASMLANLVPSPETITNPIGRALSRALHFVAFDITTAIKK